MWLPKIEIKKFGENAVFEHNEFVKVVEFSEYDPDLLDNYVTDVVKLLERKGRKIATAESCTGGLLSAYLTSVNGASAVFECGLCTYSNRIKEQLLRVPSEVLNEHGAVSRQTARAMLDGIRMVSSADLCVSVTGFAGPQGGTEQDPVGTVYVGMGYQEQSWVYCLRLWHTGRCGREFNRKMTAAFVFRKAAELLMEEDS